MQRIADKLVIRAAIDFEPGDLVRNRRWLHMKTHDALAVGVDLETVLRIVITFRMHAANRVRQRLHDNRRVDVRSNGVATRGSGLVRRPARLNAAVIWHVNPLWVSKWLSRDRGSNSAGHADLFEGAGYMRGVAIDLRGPLAQLVSTLRNSVRRCDG